MGLATIEISLGLIVAGVLCYFFYGRKKAEIDILKKGNAALTGTSNHIASAKAYIGLYVNEKEP